jgi:hypothetical protein
LYGQLWGFDMPRFILQDAGGGTASSIASMYRPSGCSNHGGREKLRMGVLACTRRIVDNEI